MIEMNDEKVEDVRGIIISILTNAIHLQPIVKESVICFGIISKIVFFTD